MKKQILSLAAALTAGLSILADAASLPAHKFTKYSSEDGLEEYIIQNIMQDHRGLMWFATWDGLYNYDGYRFRRFKAGNNGVRPANNRLDQLDEDIYGRLWMVSYDGLAYTFDPDMEQFEQVLPEGIQVAHIKLMADGTTWLISQQQELFMARRETADGALAITDFFTTQQLRRPSRINGVQMDRAGRHWIMTEEGIYRYDVQSGKVSVVANASGYEMVEREGGDTCYVGSRNGTIIEVTQDGRSTRNISLGTHSSVKMLRPHPSGQLVACTATQGVWLYTPGTAGSSAKHISRATHGALANDTIRDIYIDREGELWLRNNSAGVVHYQPRTDRARRFVIHDMYGREITDSREDQMAVEDQNGLLWVHPSGGGLAWYDRERDELVPFYNPDLQNRWSNANKLTALYSDRQGNLWFGSYGNGLEKASFSLYPFAVRSYDDQALDFAGNNVRAVLQDRDGRIWAGGKDKVVRLYDEDFRFLGNLCRDGSVRSDREESLGIVYTFMQSRDGVIWLGTKGNGLLMLTPESGGATPSAKKLKFRIRQFTMSDDNVYGLNCNDIYSLWEDHNGRIWIATYRSGVNIMQRGADGVPERFYNTRNELTTYPLISCYRSRYITGDGRGNIWIGTTSGLLTCAENFVSPDKLKFTRYRHDKSDPTSLYSNDVHAIHFTADGRCFICTFGGGLCEMTLANGGAATFRRVGSPLVGETADVLLSMQQDSVGRLWCSTEDGLTRYDLADGTVTNYHAHLFPMRFTINEGRALTLRNGELLFNTTRGLLHFNPYTLQTNHFAPPIHFNTDSILLPPDQRSFTAQFSSLDYVSPEVIAYAYRLRGFDDDWTYIGTQHTATYTNLQPGHYTLEVRSTNSSGTWADNTAALPVEVEPKFIETALAKTLQTIVALLLIAAAIGIALTIYRLRHQVRVEEQLTDLKLKFFTNVSHELRTPLTLITGPLEHIMQRPDLTPEVAQQLQIVSNNATRMSHLVTQILDFRKIEAGKMSLRVEQFDLVAFVERQMNDFKLLADAMQIRLTFDHKVGRLPIWADQDKLAQVVSNLLSNAFKYSPMGHPIRVTVEAAEPGRAIISVRDFGHGIPRERLHSIFERFSSRISRTATGMESSGIGLSLTQELVRLHHGTISVHSQPNVGSCFTVTLPTDREHFAAGTEFVIGDDVATTASGGMETSANVPIPTDDDDAPSANTPATLLIVEDNDELRHFITQIFAPHYHIMEAANGVAALRLAADQMPDIVISDVMMPEMDGFTLADRMRHSPELCHIPLVLLTALADTDNKLQGLRAGIDDYITKPFSASYLLARVENILQKRRLLQEYYRHRLSAAIAPTFTAQAEENGIGQQPTPPATLLTASDQQFIATLTDDLQRNIANADYTVEDMANAVGMSDSAYRKKCRALIGQSPSDLLRDTRMKRAAELIDARELNVAQVAYEVGYSDPHYFGKCFKAYYGMTATEWKDRRRGPSD